MKVVEAGRLLPPPQSRLKWFHFCPAKVNAYPSTIWHLDNHGLLPYRVGDYSRLYWPLQTLPVHGRYAREGSRYGTPVPGTNTLSDSYPTTNSARGSFFQHTQLLRVRGRFLLEEWDE